jgi:hypothetical protein
VTTTDELGEELDNDCVDAVDEPGVDELVDLWFTKAGTARLAMIMMTITATMPKTA